MEFAKILFWLLMILWLIGGFVWGEPAWTRRGYHIIWWILLCLLAVMTIGHPFQ